MKNYKIKTSFARTAGPSTQANNTDVGFVLNIGAKFSVIRCYT